MGERRGEAITLINIGGAYSNLGDHRRALETYEQALPILREVGDRRTEAATLNNIGAVYSNLGDKKRALETFEQALPIRREVGDRRGEAVTLFNIAKRREERGEIPEAIALLERVMALDEAVQHPDLPSHRAYLERLRASQQPRPDDAPVVPRKEAQARPARPLLALLLILALATALLWCLRKP